MYKLGHAIRAQKEELVSFEVKWIILVSGNLGSRSSITS